MPDDNNVAPCSTQSSVERDRSCFTVDMGSYVDAPGSCRSSGKKGAPHDHLTQHLQDHYQAAHHHSSRPCQSLRWVCCAVSMISGVALALAYAVLWYSPHNSHNSHRIKPAGNTTELITSILQTASLAWNISISFGWVDGQRDNESLNIMVGEMNNSCSERLDGGQGACPRTLLPAGSLTKVWTATAILRAADAGKFSHGLDTAMQPLVDRVLQPQCNFTLLQLFANDSKTVSRITIRHLLSMSSGIRDYDNDWYVQWILLRGGDRAKGGGGEEMHPCDYLRIQDARLECAPPPCKVGDYSSINYLLLGFVMQAVENQPSWSGWDQIGTAVPADRRQSHYREVAAPTTGLCSEYPAVAHQYSWVNPLDTARPVVFDYRSYSCANGWGFGNVVASAHDFAQLFRDIFAPVPARALHPLGLHPRTVLDMVDFRPCKMDGHKFAPYGLGVFNSTWARRYSKNDYTTDYIGTYAACYVSLRIALS